jgi:hypothetical protein
MDLFSRFISFLLERKWDGNVNYMPGSQTNKASQCINMLRILHPDVAMFQVGNQKTNRPPHAEAHWYLDLLRALKVSAILLTLCERIIFLQPHLY